MASEGGHLLASLDVPQHTGHTKLNSRIHKLKCTLTIPGHVSAGCQDLIVIEESTAAKISSVAGQLSGHAHSSVAVFQTNHQYTNVNKQFREYQHSEDE